MIISERKISRELSFYRALSFRTRLSEKDAKKLSVLERGYQGECIYDKVFDEVRVGSVFVFRDIYLKIEDSIAQYDALIVSDGEIIVNEIKNFSGFYRFEDGKWYVRDFPVPEDPVSQLKRAVNKLRRLNYSSRLNFEVSGKIIFPHIEFRLHSADRELWNLVVLRAGLQDYLKEFQNSYAGRHAEDIAAAVSAHIIDDPFFNKSADFAEVRKGLYCGECGSFELLARRYHFRCTSCGCRETKEVHLLRAIGDYESLFSNEKLTKLRFLKFIDYMVSPRTVLRVFNRYCKRFGVGKAAYYEFNYANKDEALKNIEKMSRYRSYAGEVE